MAEDMENSGSETYQELEKRWQAVSKLIFGQEIGGLGRYSEWLEEITRPAITKKSIVSGKEVSFVLPYYSGKSEIISLDEVNFNKRFEPISINDTKDIDSLIEAVSDRVSYTGNMLLGNSKFVENGADIVDSFYIYKSSQVSFSKYVAYGYNMEYGESVFGTVHHGNCKHSIRISDCGWLGRCFEVDNCASCSDLYYSHNCENVQDGMFCFNIKNAQYVIGNLKLEPEKYNKIKRKLLEELSQMLIENNKLPSLMELAGSSKPDKVLLTSLKKKMTPPQRKILRPELVEVAFEKTTQAVLGKKLIRLERYEKYLNEYGRRKENCISVMSGEPIILADFNLFMRYPKNRLLTETEADFAGNDIPMDERGFENFDFEKARKCIDRIGYFYPGNNQGKVDNLVESIGNVDAINCFRSMLNLYSKNLAYNFYTLESESVFGCNSVRRSKFIIKCCLSTNLTRCFEVDSSRNCSDCYFCHNCENLQDSMFCFNTKNKRNAIGNVEMPKKEYGQVKKIILAEIVTTLEKQNTLPYSVFNLADRKK